MTRVTIPVWVLVLCGLALVCSIAFALIMGTGNRDLRDNVERLETGIRAAREAQRVLVTQLGELAIDSHRLEENISKAMADLERSQERVGDLERQIADSRESSRLLGESIGRIGEWIERVEASNTEREG